MQLRVMDGPATEQADTVDAATRVGRLVTSIAAGDEAAFERFFTVTYGAVRERAHALLRDIALSEEVAQEVMIEVWRTASRFDPERGSALSWLMTMTRRRAIDRIRHEQSARRRDDNYAEARPADEDVVDLVMRHQRDERVRSALQSLTPMQAEAVGLAFFSELTYREVALALGIPVPTAKSRIRDGLRRLVSVLEQDALRAAG